MLMTVIIAKDKLVNLRDMYMYKFGKSHQPY